MHAAAPVLAGAGLFLGGCVHMPVTGVKANGEPLTVDVQTEEHSYVGQKRVGETVHRDATGRVVGTSETYEDQLVKYNVTYWQVFQGQDKIDDQDFFRIAGDNQAADQIANSRSSGLAVNRVGMVLLGVGVAALGAGLVLSATQTEKDEFNNDVAPTWPRYVAGGGLITGLIGGTLMWYGAASVAREHPINDPGRAKRDADKYNGTLGAKAPAPEDQPKKHGNL
jgi:hypothetical protein